MMQKYYHDKSAEYRANTKKLWELMNGIINKTKHRGCSISYISVDGVKMYSKKIIADEFVRFYAKLGELLAGKINQSTVTSADYISQIPRLVDSLVLAETNPTEIERIMSALPNKTSSGHDRVSNILLKQLGQSLSYPLGIIFNQSIATGSFPSLMKIAEVIPLYKGKEEDLIVNYQPVSLLMTIPKVLEKIIYKRLYKFLTKHHILYDSPYGFRSKHSCEHTILEMVGCLLQARNEGKYCTGIF